MKSSAKLLLAGALTVLVGWLPAPRAQAATYGVVEDATLAICVNKKLIRSAPWMQPITAADMASLSGYMSCLGVADLTGLEYASSLSWLALANGGYSSVAPLAPLTGLTELSLDGSNAVTDVSALAGLTNLTYLNLNKTKVTDISIVASFKSLSKFVMDATPLVGTGKVPVGTVDPSPLTGLPLTDLELSNIGLEDLSFLENNTTLTKLYFSHNYIDDLSPVSHLTMLTDLRLGDNFISDVSAMGANPLTYQYGRGQRLSGADLYVPDGATTFTYAYPSASVPVGYASNPVTWVTLSGDNPHTSSGNTITWTGLAANNADTGLVNGFTDPSPKSVISNGAFSGQVFHRIVRAHITTSALADGRVGDAYSQQIAATTGFPVAAWTIISGSVPGVSVSSAGVLSGTPTTAGAYQVTVRVTDIYGNIIDKELAITVAEAPITPTPTPSATAATGNESARVDTGIPAPASGSPWMVLLGGSLIAAAIGAGERMRCRR